MKLGKVQLPLSDSRCVEALVLPELTGFYRSVGKRGFDVSLSILMLVGMLPIILFLMIITMLDGGPPVFAHERIGKGHQRFKCLKFRTMRVDADVALKEHLANNPAARKEWQEHHKLSKDPRVTSIGRFLRRTSLDELPQLLNVISGDMSFVGPRPVTHEELERYGAHLPKYLALRPGVTGLWQVNGRGRVSYEERVKMDADYFYGLSFLGDLGLMLKTCLVVFQCRGR